MEMSSRKRWNVYTIRTRQGLERPFWFKIGVAFMNGDGSVNLYLDAMPLDGKLQMREWRDDAQPSLPGANGVPMEPEGVEAF